MTPNPQPHQCTCALAKGPTPIPNQIQNGRQQLHQTHQEQIHIHTNNFHFDPQMVISDIIFNFPATLPHFQEIDPLFTPNSPSAQFSIEIFLFGTGIDSQTFCQQLNQLK